MCFLRLCFFILLFASPGIVPAEVLSTPSLAEKCGFFQFQVFKLKDERSKAIDVNLFNQNLVQQLSYCYQKFIYEELTTCHFQELKYDSIKYLIQWADFKEHEVWGIPEEEFFNHVYPVKKKFFEMMSVRLPQCFTQDNLQGISKDTFQILTDIISSMTFIPPHNHMYRQYFPKNTVQRVCLEPCHHGKDPVNYYIQILTFNRLSLINSDRDPRLILKVAR